MNQFSKKKWRYVFLSILLMMMYGTVYSWSIFRVPVEKYFGIGSTLSGFPYMTSLLLYAISMLIGGQLIGKYSPRKLLYIGGVLIFTGWILSSFSNSIVMLTLSYGVIIGFGVGISYGVPIYVIAKWFPTNNGMIVGLVLAGFGLSPLITAPLGHWFIDNHGLKETFLYFGIAFGILIPAVSTMIRLPNEEDHVKQQSNVQHQMQGSKTKMIKEKNFKFTYTSFFIGTLIGLTIIGLTNNVGVELIGIDSGSIALLMTVFAIFNGMGRPLFGWLTEKLGPKVSMKISYLLIIVASLSMIFAREGFIILYVIAFSVLWLNLGAWLAIAPIMTMKLYGMESYSQNYGIMFTAYGVGAVIGVVSTGILIDLLGSYKLIFVLIITVALIGIALSNGVVIKSNNEEGKSEGHKKQLV